MSRPTRRVRLAIAAAAGVGLLAALWMALALLGLPVPVPRPNFTDLHGPLMVLGFLGTLIALERAAALGSRAGFLAPAAAAAGVVVLLLGLPLAVGQTLLLAGGVGLVALYTAAARRQASLHLTVMAAGALGWVAAAAWWEAGADVSRLVPYFAAFLVLTVAGERLELSRVVRLSRPAQAAFTAAVVPLAAGALASTASPAVGVRVTGAGLVLLALWLARYDVARRTVRMARLPRYMAVCLLAGYAWLAAAGLLWLRFATLTDGPAYDAMLHALFLGFVLGLVFAHAPVIVPAVFRAPLPYRHRFYVPLALLHASLLLRVVGGDLAGDRLAWQLGGVLNEVALLAFLAIAGQAVHAAQTCRRPAIAASLPRAQLFAARTEGGRP